MLYFGDDDNSYDLRLFDEIRDTRNISMFPVGLVGDYAVSAPVVYDVTFIFSLPLKKTRKTFLILFFYFGPDELILFVTGESGRVLRFVASRPSLRS